MRFDQRTIVTKRANKLFASSADDNLVVPKGTEVTYWKETFPDGGAAHVMQVVKNGVEYKKFDYYN